MHDLSDNIHIKKLCMKLSHDENHKRNMSSIESIIKIQLENGLNIDWKIVKSRCVELLRLTIRHHQPPGVQQIRLVEKVWMAENLLEIFKKKYEDK